MRDARQPAQDGQRGVLRDAADEHEALALAVLRSEADARADGVAGLRDADRPAPAMTTAPGRPGSSPKMHLGQLGAAGADEPGEADHLAGAELEGHAAVPVAADVLDLEHAASGAAAVALEHRRRGRGRP